MVGGVELDVAVDPSARLGRAVRAGRMGPTTIARIEVQL